jgi:hypothetical protein
MLTGVFQICNRIQDAGKALLHGMDTYAIRLNRSPFHIRFTAAAVTIIGLPMIFLASTYYTVCVDKERIGPCAVGVLGAITTSVLLFKRYAWVTGANLFSLPQEIHERLFAELKELAPEDAERMRDFLKKNININNPQDDDLA